MTVFAYYRVSTDKQDYESQKIGVVEYANRMGLTIDKEIVDDGVSGTVKACKRNLKKFFLQMKYGDTVITSELSRLGRQAGVKNQKHWWTGRESEIELALLSGDSFRKIAHRLEVSPTTLHRYIKTKNMSL